MKKNSLGEATRCVHSPKFNLSEYKGVTTPIFTATAYEYVGVDKYVYPRYFNTPNISVVEQQLAILEKSESAILFSSGMAATITVLFSFLRKGDHIILQQDIYGGTYDSVKVEMEKIGVDCSFVESDIESFQSAIKPETKIIFFESPSNPLLNVTDIEGIVNIAKESEIITVFDNTFASPVNQNPHTLGIDIIIQSGTKYLGGHSDICCGVATMSNENDKIVRETAIHFGGNPDPQTAYLLERSIKTLSLRVQKQTDNALKIARFLETQKSVKKVFYPGLESAAGHDLAKKQMKGFGAMLSFEVDGNADDFVNKLELVRPVMSLGSIETTVTSPVQTSHARMPKEEREKLGISDALIRMSVGIEDADDIISDIEQALL